MRYNMPNQAMKNMQHINLINNNNLPALWVDSFRVGVREDKIVSINFYAAQPDGQFEQTRVVSGQEPLKNLINTLCKSMDYYPIKDSSEKA